MNYAVWIALAVVFVAVVPPIIKGARAKSKGDGGSADGGSSGSSDTSCNAGSDGGGDCGGGD